MARLNRKTDNEQGKRRLKRVINLLHDKYRPEAIFLTQTSSVGYGMVIKEAWKNAYPDEQAPKFFTIDVHDFASGSTGPDVSSYNFDFRKKLFDKEEERIQKIIKSFDIKKACILDEHPYSTKYYKSYFQVKEFPDIPYSQENMVEGWLGGIQYWFESRYGVQKPLNVRRVFTEDKEGTWNLNKYTTKISYLVPNDEYSDRYVDLSNKQVKKIEDNAYRPGTLTTAGMVLKQAGRSLKRDLKVYAVNVKMLCDEQITGPWTRKNPLSCDKEVILDDIENPYNVHPKEKVPRKEYEPKLIVQKALGQTIGKQIAKEQEKKKLEDMVHIIAILGFFGMAAAFMHQVSAPITGNVIRPSTGNAAYIWGFLLVVIAGITGFVMHMKNKSIKR